MKQNVRADTNNTNQDQDKHFDTDAICCAKRDKDEKIKYRYI